MKLFSRIFDGMYRTSVREHETMSEGDDRCILFREMDDKIVNFRALFARKNVKVCFGEDFPV
jgi:hypothetical protein